jgi:glutathione synthase/RimK-type ligase-like ATP-grasp enzyme
VSRPASTVLLVTHAADHFTVDRVAHGVACRGLAPVRLDTDRFPGQVQLTARAGRDGVSARLRAPGIDVAMAAVHSVWLRRVASPPRPDGLSELEAAQCVRESRAALEAFLAAASDARWLDPLSVVRRAENKLVQLREAQRAGLRVPRTVIGNDPDDVRALWDACGGDVVTKMLTPVAQAMGPAPAMYTTRLTADDLEELDGLALSPMVFQERVDKQRELRVVYVAGRCFTGARDACGDDWRRPGSGAGPWQPDELPDEVASQLDAAMRGLGLGFGAADLVRARDGTHHFLEVNPVGEWGMLERDLGLPIADAIAEQLCRPR